MILDDSSPLAELAPRERLDRRRECRIGLRDPQRPAASRCLRFSHPPAVFSRAGLWRDVVRRRRPADDEGVGAPVARRLGDLQPFAVLPRVAGELGRLAGAGSPGAVGPVYRADARQRHGRGHGGLHQPLLEALNGKRVRVAPRHPFSSTSPTTTSRCGPPADVDAQDDARCRRPHRLRPGRNSAIRGGRQPLHPRSV